MLTVETSPKSDAGFLVNSTHWLGTKRLLRVFPRRTNATPDDPLSIVGRSPELFDEADVVHISVAFEWDIPKAECLAKQWECVAPVSVGGPALRDVGSEFTPGLYLKPGYTITSRGCPNRCWFCRAWKIEGNTVRELEVKDGWNVLDNNLLACSQEHQRTVFEMLARQPRRPVFTGGLEAARLTAWHVEWLARLRPKVMWFAYDEARDWEPLVAAANLLREAGLISAAHEAGCFVLCGWKGDKIEDADERCLSAARLGFFPQAMLYDRGRMQPVSERKAWVRFARTWSNKIIVGAKMRDLAAAVPNKSSSRDSAAAGES